MQLTVENVGQALIHLSKARTMMRAQYDNLASCASCSEESKRSMYEGSVFFDNLYNQLRGQVDGQE